MTVAELIEKLQGVNNQDAVVLVEGDFNVPGTVWNVEESGNGDNIVYLS